MKKKLSKQEQEQITGGGFTPTDSLGGSGLTTKTSYAKPRNAQGSRDPTALDPLQAPDYVDPFA